MAARFEAVRNSIEGYISDVKKAMPIDKVYLYGSYAKGNPTKQSDVDICFFSKSFENKRTVDILMELLGLTLKYNDVFIEPRAFPLSELENDNPFVKEIVRTGREIIP
jgi:predicted nucleotidyltransferase